VGKVDSLDQVRKFHSGVLGYDVSRHKRAITFRDDHQYNDFAQTLERESDDKPIRIGFETKDARRRSEVVIRKPVQETCCSENMDPYK
jgi:hypothetical protein